MTTQKQIDANQRNAQKSTRPITEAGKLTVGRNATTHGLTAARVLPEEQEDSIVLLRRSVTNGSRRALWSGFTSNV